MPLATRPAAPYAVAKDASRDAARWGALALVFTAAMINYMDRQAIALLKPEMEQAFGWSDTDYAHIVSGFQLATIASMLAVGWFVDRVGLRAGYAIGVGGWSLAQMAHVLATTVTGFFFVRALLGALEAVNLPAAVKTVAAWFPGADRSFALGVMNVAPNIGAVATPLIVPAIALAWGWKAAFIATGAVGLVWLAGWLALPARLPTQTQTPQQARPRGSILAVATDRRTWAISVGKLLTDFVWVFLLFWGPDLFVKMYGLTTAQLVGPVALVFVLAAAGSFFAGSLSSWMLASGRSLDASRKTPMLIAAVLALPVWLVMWSPNVWVAATLLGLTLAAHQMFSTSIFGLATDITPPARVGVTIGFAATVAGLGGLAMNEFTGFTLEATGSYAPMLALCAGAKLAAVIAVHLIVPDVDRTRREMAAAV
jgi:ACS family hexuronate transporter-like MFS transporter